ncbi:uncharacterized protein LOC143855918 [Tasmannia lanceolata]|uniref:uncharacterized protein LOC143855918 n=1 Tax=Tasmannia lanceolata TaxID=3420 RepID=UPI004063AE90
MSKACSAVSFNMRNLISRSSDGFVRLGFNPLMFSLVPENPVVRPTIHMFLGIRDLMPLTSSHLSEYNDHRSLPYIPKTRNFKSLRMPCFSKEEKLTSTSLGYLRTISPMYTIHDVLGISTYYLPQRCFSTFFDLMKEKANSTPYSSLGRRGLVTLPLPHRTIPEPKGQDLDFVNITHSHLINTDWAKLNAFSSSLTPFRIKHILLKIQKDHVLSLEFFNWVELERPNIHTLETHSIILHILTKAKKFRIAESLLKKTVIPKTAGSVSELFDAILYSYRLCYSSPHVFDCLFKTYAHLKKFRNATDTFCRMKDYGFLPTIESCNAYISSLLDLHRSDIILAFYREIHRCRISPNVYTLNMVICALCNSGKLEKATEVFRGMEDIGCIPTVASFNTLIAGNCKQGLLSSAMKLKTVMLRNGLHPNVITYNTLVHGFCKAGKLHDANKIFSEMKAMNVAPNTVTYNTLIDGYSQLSNSEMGARLYEEMLRNEVKVDILTYNALILGLCKEGKTKKASYLVKELDRENLIPNASTYSALISGQCKRQNSERAFQLYKGMKKSRCNLNADTFKMLISTFCKNEDFEGAVQVFLEMLEISVAPDLTLLVELFEGLCKCGKGKVAMELCMEVEGRHLMPVGFDEVGILSSQLHNES